MFTRRSAIKYSAAISAALAYEPAFAKKLNAQKKPVYADAIETMRRIKSGEIDVVKNLEQTIQNAQILNPKLNALVFTSFDEARQIAKNTPKGIFGGLPFAIKDLNDYHNTKTQHGSRAYKDALSGAEIPVVKKFDEMGIISIGKTAAPEFGLTASTETLAHGATRNPWNLDHTTGGSSGGAGAMVSSGILKVAHASDGGGSIRIPAACCGLVGLKTSRGRLLRKLRANYDQRKDIGVHGVLTRTIRDTATFIAGLENPQSGLNEMGLVLDANKKRLKIGYCANAFNNGFVDNEVKLAVLKTANILRDLGHELIPFQPIINYKEIEDAFILLWSAGAASEIGEWAAISKKAPGPEYFEPWALFLANNFQKNKDKFPKALETLGALQSNFKSSFLPRFDVLLTPTVATPAPKIGHLSTAIDPELHYKRVLEFTPFFCAIMNAAGVPALSLPISMSNSGLPIGIQLAADMGHEKILLELGYELEKANPWVDRIPSNWAI